MKTRILFSVLVVLMFVFGIAPSSAGGIYDPGPTIPRHRDNPPPKNSLSASIQARIDDQKDAGAHGRMTPNAPASFNNIAMLGQIGGGARGVVAQGNYVYMGEGPRLVVLDISNVASITKVWTSTVMSGLVSDIAISGSYLYVAAGDAGLRVFSLANPEQPVEIGYFDSPGSANGVTISGTVAYLADGFQFMAVNISDPTHPGEIAHLDLPAYSYGIDSQGTWVYVADGFSGLQIIDASNPAGSSITGSIDTPGRALNVDAIGNYAYIADSGGGLRVVNISTPSSPVETGSWGEGTYEYYIDVQVIGSIAYAVAEWNLGLLLAIDVSNPADPHEVGYSYTYYLYPTSVFMTGNRAYVADEEAGLMIYDVTNPVPHPTQIGMFRIFGVTYGVDTQGNYAYVAGDGVDMRVVDASNPAQPVLAGSYEPDVFDPGMGSYNLVVSGNTAYIAEFDGLLTLNVSNPASPSRYSFYDFPDYGGYNLAAEGTTVYATDDSDLDIIDLSNPSSPTLLGTFSATGYLQDVHVTSGTAYLAADIDGLRIVDVSNPASPSEVGFYATPSDAYSVYTVGNTAYVGDSLGDLRILDVSDPAHPSELGIYDVGESVWDIYVEGDTAYVAAFNNFYMVDVSDPIHPTLMGYFDVGGYSYIVSVRGNLIYLASSNGLYILQYLGESLYLPMLQR